jgi:hypothetical protein
MPLVGQALAVPFVPGLKPAATTVSISSSMAPTSNSLGWVAVTAVPLAPGARPSVTMNVRRRGRAVLPVAPILVATAAAQAPEQANAELLASRLLGLMRWTIAGSPTVPRAGAGAGRGRDDEFVIVQSVRPARSGRAGCCSHCTIHPGGTPIRWALTCLSKLSPFDRDPNADAAAPTSQIATCPDAKRWSKRPNRAREYRTSGHSAGRFVPVKARLSCNGLISTCLRPRA